jgi:hypothetical protein
MGLKNSLPLNQKSLVRASALERGLMSWIMNDMLLGAIAASTGLWVIGIMVMVSYLVIMAWGGERGRMGEYEVELQWSSGGASVELW